MKNSWKMCFLLSLLCCVFILAANPWHAFARDITLQWDPNEEPNLAGYYVCYNQGYTGNRYRLATYQVCVRVPIDDTMDPNNLADPSIPQFTVIGLDERQTYYFVVAAYNNEVPEIVSLGSQEVFVVGSDEIPSNYQNDYDRAWGISSGALEGFMFFYSSAEKVTPTFGSSQDVPTFSLRGYDPAGPLLNLLVSPPQPAGFTFRAPVTLLIPVPYGYEEQDLSIGLYEFSWVLVWDGVSQTQKGGWDWLAGDPVYHMTNPLEPSGPPLVELAVKHFTGVQMAAPGGGVVVYGRGGCFIESLLR